MGKVVESVGDFLLYTGFFLYGIQLKILGQIIGKEPPRPGRSELKDRTATIVASEAPYVYVYGRARIGSAIVAILTSGTKDEYKHLVCVHASHQCDAIEDIYINGKSLGTLDSNGDVTSGDYFKSTPTQIEETLSGTVKTLAHTPVTGTLRLIYTASDSEGVDYQVEEFNYTLVGLVLTAAVSRAYRIQYTYNLNISYVRIKKHLGVAGDPADATTIAEVPTKWTTNHKLSGHTYTIVRLDLNFRDFQQGAPTVEVLLRGKLLHDVRSGSYPNDTPLWSQNVALMVADYLTSEICGVPYTDLPPADFIAAANVCDQGKLTGCTYTQNNYGVVTVTKVAHGKTNGAWVDVEILSGTAISGTYKVAGGTADTFFYNTPTSYSASGNATVEGLYTANGVVFADQNQREVLNKMVKAMAGSIVGTSWGIMAGKYIAPIMPLTQAEIVGGLSYTGGSPEAELFNGVKGQYISQANNYVATDFEPYQNTAYVTADGAELWTDLDFAFTTSKQRVHNLARIYTEDQRNGFTLKADFSYKCWALQIGQRVTFTSAFLGQTNKIYRVVDKNYSIDSAVSLTLKEDAASIWDLQNAVIEDSTPNTSLPNPFYTPPPGNLRLISEALYETTGSAGAKVKILVGWDAPADVNVLQYEIESKPYFTALYANKTTAINTQAEIFDVGSGRYDFRVRAINHLGIFSSYVSKTVEVFGLTTPPGNVTGFTVIPFNGSALCRWARTADLDVKLGGDVQIRFTSLTSGASWERSVILPDGAYNGDAANAIVSLATGTYFIKFIDSTGHYSTTAASFVVTESLITAFTPVLTSTQHPTFSGTKTDCVVSDTLLKLDSVTLIDSMTTLMDSWGYLDSIGGIKSLGVYEFDATMDLGAIATRRFHSHIASLGYNAADLFDDRLDLMDSWADFDGGVINDTTATVLASVSDDNIIFGSWTPFKVADFKCRYAKFKAELVSGDPIHNIQISELSVVAKLP